MRAHTKSSHNSFSACWIFSRLPTGGEERDKSFHELCEEVEVETPLMNETKWRVGDVVVIWSEEISFY